MKDYPFSTWEDYYAALTECLCTTSYNMIYPKYYEKTSEVFSIINKLSKMIADQGDILIVTSKDAFELIDNSLIEVLQKNLLNIKAEFHLSGGEKQDYFSECFQKTY
jgi:hypothetical protein